jgi:uncharacterized membrane protein YebE (DUF533 family)
MSLFKRSQNQGQKRSPLLKFAIAAAAAIFVGATAIALATVTAITASAAATIGLGALAGSVIFGVVGGCLGVLPGILYARAVNKSRGDGWHSSAAVLTGIVAGSIIGLGYGAYEGYKTTAHRLMDNKGNAKTSFNIKAAPQQFVPANSLVLTTKMISQYKPTSA